MDFLVSPKYWKSQWRALDLNSGSDEEWLKAIDIVEDRIRGRFVQWIDRLIGQRFSGFSVVALDCMFLESLHGFKTGRPSEGNCKTYKEFLTNSKSFSPPFDDATAIAFCKNVRNAMLHDGETRKGWLIAQSVPEGAVLVRQDKGAVLNRTEFHLGLVSEFETWLRRLRNGDHEARQNMQKRMEQIIGIHFEDDSAEK